MQTHDVVVEVLRPPQPLGTGAPPRKQHGVLCQVPGCGIDLSQSRLFHQRYHVCPTHCTAETVVMDGTLQRFCQQCGQFHDVERFSPGMRSCRAQLARHAERRRLRRAQAKAAAEAQRGQEVAQAQHQAAAGSGAAMPPPPSPQAHASADAMVTSAAQAQALLGGKRAHSPTAAVAAPPAKVAAASPRRSPQPQVPPQAQAQLQSPPDGLVPLAQQQGSTASDHSARSTHAHLPPVGVDVLLLAAAAGVQAQAVMAGDQAQVPVVAPWALPPGQWPGTAGWPWAQLWPGAAAPPPLLWGAPLVAAAAPAQPAPTDLLQLLLQQALPQPAAAAPPPLLPAPQSPTGPQPPAQLDQLVAAFRAAAEQHLRQQQTDMQVAALLARLAQQTPEQNAEQMQQLLSALVQPV